MDAKLDTLTEVELAGVTGGFLPLLLGAAAAGTAAAAWYYGGGINVGVAHGDNNRLAVGNSAPTSLGDNSPVQPSAESR